MTTHRSLDLLILGGTLFVGRHLAEAALARGHRVTLFHRGRTNPGVLPEVEHVIGDRDGGLDALGGRTWDAVVDTSGYVPRVVGAAAERLADAVEHYTFVSSQSVYADTSASDLDEQAAVATIPDPLDETLTGTSYGALKVLCERVVDAVFPGRALHVRPGLIVGPRDPTDRFTWWVRRVASGGEVLAPGDPHAPVQFVHARDLADWMVRMIEERRIGIFNATGPTTSLTLGRTLETMRAATGSNARFTWIEERFLTERNVTPWSELPLWVPAENAGFLAVNASRAWEAGLAFRPLEDTVRETLEWDRATPVSERPAKTGLPIAAGMAPERETELLREWNQRKVASQA